MPDLDQRLVSHFKLDTLPDGDTPRSWIQVMIAGDFKHPRYGDFKITETDLAGYAADIQARAEDILIDFDHESAEGNTKAAGWYTGQTEIKPDDEGRPALFAEVEWTPAGAESIRNREYRKISPEFTTKWRDATGALKKGYRMLATALTNRPFLPNMAAVTLSDSSVVWAPDDGYCWISAEINEALNPGDTYRYWVRDVARASDRALVSASAGDDTWVVPFQIVDGEVQVSPSSDWTEAEQEWVDAAPSNRTGGPAAQAQEDDMELKDIAVGLGLAADADEDAIKARFAELKTAEEKATGAPDETTIKQLTASAAKGEQAAKELHDMKRDMLLKDAVNDGKILPVQKDAFATMYDNDPDGVRTLLDATPAKSFAPVGVDGDTTEDEHKLPAAPEHVMVDGARYSVSEESFKLAERTKQILAEAGKEYDHTDEDFMRASAKAQDELKLTYEDRQ